MCLSIPSKVKSIDENNYAIVETLGVERGVSLDLISEPVRVGDYVLIHVGFAMEKIDTAYALESLKAYEEIAKMMKDGTIDKFEGDMGLLSKNS
ncbi:HypC/HybG/HupF family hydrogenase formation chaperone [Campylobacter sp. RM12327]|uniref:HypC/HybG/HupF family hydrogenase formation chaperone n=1 Tax=Campylobacter sputorum TaxID=206 RepID=UPI000B7810DF|nr:MULTISPECIES: HypC/HybG/HupF family hydrogenase formation chaperone [Campylobacter]ASM39768.1 hydrogenase assembly chaperone HypC [Campylobacter sputorum]MBE7358030.1 HypC/HybG/HupF family hydrogenase formation chaperone [Campylobacter sp. RM11302]MBF6668842.1 HypC/HybG/HupF family hydrogenase formation chaperone [Campylobacter sp. RM12327]MBF6673756.1 HypC/HybG/HupF family hydrogenase formation chaperone [Campylobacter sp. RM13538]MBF6676229.1 HypC/HybG/HupF family hydrogenase formation ch